ncbi:MAG: hypothetical protein U0T73_07355 [Chitinophagales bacterium]
MKNVLLLIGLLFTGSAYCQMNFEKVGSLKNLHVTVKVLGPELIAVVPESGTGRYSAGMLPKELQQDGLPLIVRGDVGKIPPNVRMIGTPFRITCIKVSAADKKKYHLSKRKYSEKDMVRP